ncbi:MAG: DedA family protein [Acidimicrobiales bacterium]
MEHFLATWGYLALFIITTLSALGIPVGSELAMAYAGALASGHLTGRHDQLDIVLVAIVASIGDVAGSSIGYAIGRFGGRALVDRVGKYLLLTHKDLDRAEAWFDRFGESAVLFGRFIPLVRSFVSVVAGVAEMTLAKFLLFTTIACSIWCVGLTLMGYALGASWSKLLNDFKDAGYVATAVAVVIVAVFFAHRLRAVRTERSAHRS